MYNKNSIAINKIEIETKSNQADNTNASALNQIASASKLLLHTKLLEIQAKFQLSITEQLEETIVHISPANYIEFALFLRDSDLKFSQLIDLCAVDYQEFNNYNGPRYAVVLQLLSITQNMRLRVKIFLEESNLIIPSITKIWSSADWYEREAFDLFGILFDGHEDLRRILTDYGFIGHPMRKNFPVTGFVEVRYDEEKKRVIYQPITIEERIITPRITREDKYAE